MICAYCGKEARGTREHIISCGILDLFPECFVTIDNVRKNIYLGDPVVKDVCAECNNNKISYIDSYAKNIISEYFVQKYKKDDIIDFTYNYTLIQKILLKYAFNDLRSHKDDISFFTSKILNFLMDKDINTPLKNVTVLAGIPVNTSPVPDFMYGNNKIRWGKNPIFLSNSIVNHLDYDTGKINLREENPPEKFKKMKFSYLFRFNSVQFLLICWDENISDDDLKSNKIMLEYQYPYTILSEKGNHKLSRCTSEITYHNEMLIDVSWGQSIFDEITFMRETYSDKGQKSIRKLENDWEEIEKDLSEKFHR